MIPFVNISNFLKYKNFTITFRVAHWDALDDNLGFGMQEDDIFERTNDKCHVFT